MHFAEMSMGKTNPTELVALLIVQGKNFVEALKRICQGERLVLDAASYRGWYHRRP